VSSTDFWAKAAQQQTGRVRLGVTADDHDFFAHFDQTRHRVLGCGGFADAAFAVDCYLSH
jgi:hypothetical protein